MTSATGPATTGPPALPPPTTSQLSATPCLSGIPTELRDDIFYHLIKDKASLPIIIYVFGKECRTSLRDKFSSLFLAGRGAAREDALHMWNSNSVQFIKFRYYEEDSFDVKPFIWAFSRGWRPFGAPTSRRLYEQQMNFEAPHPGLSPQEVIRTTDNSAERAKERMLDCLRHVQNVHLGVPHRSFNSESQVETYLNDAKWLVDSLNVSPMLRKVYLYIGWDPDWRVFSVPTPATDERRRRLKEVLKPFENLNNVEVEVLNYQDWGLNRGPGTAFADLAIVDYVNDLRRLAKRLPGQQLIDKYFVSSQPMAVVQSAFQPGELEKRRH